MHNKDYFEQISFEEFETIFNDFNKEAFRIELLDQYLVDGEKTLFDKSKEKKLTDEEFLKSHVGWLDFLKSSVDKGKRIIRVHAVSEPYSDYLNFEINFPYKHNIKFGEEIKLLKKEKSFLDYLSQYPHISDFWLFDDSQCIFLEYKKDGSFIGIKKLKDEYIDEILPLKFYILEKSKKLII